MNEWVDKRKNEQTDTSAIEQQNNIRTTRTTTHPPLSYPPDLTTPDLEHHIVQLGVPARRPRVVPLVQRRLVSPQNVGQQGVHVPQVEGRRVGAEREAVQGATQRGARRALGRGGGGRALVRG